MKGFTLVVEVPDGVSPEQYHDVIDFVRRTAKTTGSGSPLVVRGLPSTHLTFTQLSDMLSKIHQASIYSQVGYKAARAVMAGLTRTALQPLCMVCMERYHACDCRPPVLQTAMAREFLGSCRWIYVRDELAALQPADLVGLRGETLKNVQALVVYLQEHPAD